MQSLDELFGPRGPLARTLPGFTPRRSQLAMANRVALAIENRAPLVVEAGTGTGKTFAYLVPALLSGKRVLISTGTRTLQDQLFNKDLPLVAGAIGVPARVALLKGRSNYLCSYRLRQLGGQKSLAGTRDRTLTRVERWAGITKSGDLSEVPDLSDAHPLWPQITSTRENCLGSPLRRHRPVSRGRSASQGDRSRHRHRQSPSAACGSRAQGRRLRRPAGRRGCGDPRRGAPDPGSRHAVFRHAPRQPPGRAAAARRATRTHAVARARHDAQRRVRRRGEVAAGARGSPAGHAAARLARRGYPVRGCRAGPVALAA